MIVDYDLQVCNAITPMIRIQAIIVASFHALNTLKRDESKESSKKSLTW